MGHSIKVTTITPVYNNAPYLADCIDSLLNQTYPNVEHIFVDDGSSDGSSGILMKYRDHPNVRILFKGTNEGIAAAYRDAQKMATGSVLCFLDADDIASENRLSLTVEAFERNPSAGFVYSPLDLIDRTGKPFGLLAEVPEYVKNESLFYNLMRRNYFTGSSLAVRNYDWLMFDLDVLCCDYDVCLQIAQRRIPFVYIEVPLVQYRIHGANNSNNGARMLASVNAVHDRYSFDELYARWTDEHLHEALIFTTFGFIEYYYRKNVKKAKTYFERAKSAGSQVAETYFYLGCMQYNEGEWTSAYESFLTAEACNPGLYQVLNNLAVVGYLLDGQKQIAEARLLKAIELQPYYLLIKKNYDALISGLELRLIPLITDEDNVLMTYCRLQS